MNRCERRNCLIFAILGALLCLSLAVVAGIFYNLPAQAEATFGPPSASLDPIRHFLYSALLLWQADDLTQPADPAGEARSFHVEIGESAPSVIGRLWEERFINNPGAFRTYLTYAGFDTTLQAGNYKLSAAMTPLEIARALQDATPSEVTFPILPGWRAEEIAASLPTSGLDISEDAFLAAVHRRYADYSFTSELPSPPTVEGFLFPGEYVVERDITARQFVRMCLDRFEAQVDDSLRQGFARQNFNIFEAVTLASIVEREAIVQEEMPLIASVFINRLGKGMKLDSDPTVQYAIGYNEVKSTWWTNPLSLQDLEFDSPYNTYRNAGLPPGPIANPSLEALQAIAFPARTPYFYFRAGCENTSRHLFAETFEEHLANECK
jgi:UPF0755 protein